MAAKPSDIAIVGMSCLFPGAGNLASFWQNIVDAKDCITEPPSDWEPADSVNAGTCASEPLYIRKGGYLGDLSRFQPINYGVLPASVEGAEPDQYLALRCAYEALLDAGIPGAPLARERTGVYVGRGIYFNRGTLSWIQHGLVIDQMLGLLRQMQPELSDSSLRELREEFKRSLPPFRAESVSGLVPCLLTGRIANRLDLNGPTYTIDAACASALVALEHGVKDLRSGACDAVLVGGVQVTTSVLIHQLFCQIEGLSKTGQVAPFSAGANGTLLGEGCGMMLLKRRADAERDGHRIYAIVRGVGLSSDGRGAGLLAPRSEGQQLAISRAYSEAQVNPASIALLEAHGTGLPIGDRVELESIRAFFGDNRPAGSSLAVGSVKSMIGHLLPASGAASLIKTALAVYHRTLPPTLHAEQPAPELEGVPVALNITTRPWIHGSRSEPRRAGVNAFGFGGINAHAILEEDVIAEETLPSLARDWPTELVVVSANNDQALRARVAELTAWVQRAEGVALLDIAAACAAEDGPARLSCIATNVAELLKKWQQATKLWSQPERTKIQDRNGIFWQQQPLAATGRVAFMYPGEGGQYVNMLKDLCLAFPEVRREFDLTDRAFQKIGPGIGLSQQIFPAAGDSTAVELHTNESGLSMVTTAERALTALMTHLGIQPEAIVGHSNGEFGALHAAGAFADGDSEEGLIRLITQAAQATADWVRPNLVPDVAMLSVGGVPPAVLEDVMQQLAGRVSIVIDNCPNQIVLAGDEQSITKAWEMLRGKGGLCEKLPWKQPYHTPEFAPACEVLDRFVRAAELGTPTIETWSCVTAAPHPADPEEVRQLAVCQLSRKLRFRETIQAMYAAGVRVFIEVGPRGILSTFVGDILGKQPHAAVPLDLMHRRGLEQLCHALGRLAAHGVSLKLDELYRRRSPRPLNFGQEPPRPAKPAPTLPLALPQPRLSEKLATILRKEHLPSLQEGPGTGSPTTTATAPVLPLRQVSVPAPIISAGEVELRVTTLQPVSKEASTSSPNGNGLQSAVDKQATASLRPANTIPSELAISATPAQKTINLLGARQPRAKEMAEFQETMRQFLGTQEIVTRQFLHGVPARRTAQQPRLTRPISRESRTAPRRELPPFLDHIVKHVQTSHIIAETVLTVPRCSFLKDHAFFGRGLSVIDQGRCGLPVMPLAGTLEIIAEAASLLRPGLLVRALRSIKTSRWLVFDKPERRLRVEAAELSSQGDIQATLYDLDEDPQGGAAVATCILEFAPPVSHLGGRVIPDLAVTPFRFADDEIYRFLFHGPAFQGITHMEAVDPHATRCRVQEPDPAYLAAESPDRLSLPVALLDLCGQIAGMVLRDVAREDVVTLSFPNSVERVEFAEPAARRVPLLGVSRVRMTESQLGSDVEMSNERGEVVLRAVNRIEELARLPADLYSYRHTPQQSHMSRQLDIFADVPGGAGCIVRQTGNIGHKALVNNIWSLALSHQILSVAEQTALTNKKFAPVSAMSWLLGRVVAKDVIRQFLGHQLCMVDVEIGNGEFGEPLAVLLGGLPAAPRISLSHKTFFAVAAAADPEQFLGIGIDVEPLRVLAATVYESAFRPSERALIDRTANAAGSSLAAWRISAWCAKEAATKALSRGGVLSELEIIELDSATGRLSVQLHGSLAARLQELAPGSFGSSRLDVYRRFAGDSVIALCLISRNTNRS